MKAVVFLILLGAFGVCTPGRILFLAPVPSKSHFILSERLVEGLSERGHHIIFLAPFRRLKSVENVQEILTPDVSQFLLDDNSTENETDDEKFQIRHKISSLFSTSRGAEVLLERTLTHQPVVDLLNSQQNIDLVVGISTSAEGLLAGFAHKFNAPMVFISTWEPDTNLNELVGNPAPSSYVSDGSLGYTDRMNFCQRLVNFFQTTVTEIMFYAFHLPRQDHLMRKYFGNDVPPLKKLLSNTSLVLVNHHFGLGFPRPNLPNMIEIGGFHVRKAKPLPEDLQEFIDEAEDGVIYINLGSKSQLPTETFDGILKTFSNLTQNVLWKFKNENLKNLPQNVRISKCLPQSDILAHPNVKLFITHGGLLSLTESIYRGVPVLGVPIHPDQSANLRHVENLKLGLQLDAINEETMSSAIQQIFNDTTYSRNAKLRSEILQDRPLQPMDTAAYWLEYLMRHKGAPHLRSGGRYLSWYQLYQLDVFLLFWVILFVAIFLFREFSSWVLGIVREAATEEKFLFKKTN